MSGDAGLNRWNATSWYFRGSGHMAVWFCKQRGAVSPVHHQACAYEYLNDSVEHALGDTGLLVESLRKQTLSLSLPFSSSHFC